MKKFFKFGAGSFLATTAICAVAYYVFAFVFVELNYTNKNSNRENLILSNFQTVTVEVDILDSSIKNIFGYDQDKLSALAADIACPLIKRKFSNTKIICSKYNDPITFQSNPLNLAIIFEVSSVFRKRLTEHNDRKNYNMGVVVARSPFVTLLDNYDEITLGKAFQELQYWGRPGFINPYKLRLGSDSSDKNLVGIINEEKELIKHFEFLTEMSLERMEPHQTRANEKEVGWGFFVQK